MGSEKRLHETRDFGCMHREYLVDSDLRTVKCQGCYKELDAFETLLQLTRTDGYAQMRADDAAKVGARLAFLKGEEQRVKARLKNAKRKDADAAVAEERKRWSEKLERARYRAKEAHDIMGQVLRLLGERGSPAPEQPRAGKGEG